MVQKKDDNQAMAYEAPTMEKHDPVKVVQGSGDDTYCTYFYSYYYRSVREICYYTYYYY